MDPPIPLIPFNDSYLAQMMYLIVSYNHVKNEKNRYSHF